MSYFPLVSMSLCEIPPPSQELVEKYDSLKSVFLKRLMNAFDKVSKSALVENHREAVVAFAGDLQSKPELNAAAGVASALAEEALPLIDKARSSVLGMYEYYLRPYIGNTLNDGIGHIKVVLDKYLPAEVHFGSGSDKSTHLLSYINWLGAESFRVPRQTEEEQGTLSKIADKVKAFYDSSVDTASEYLESIRGLKLEEKAKNLYTETTTVVTTYTGILHDQLYHIFYSQQ
ncbi:hypothetical protein INR49_001555 [Caranx melampygus]|nr:hypothetical protein INR49_001555 [Caranx melampygus]